MPFTAYLIAVMVISIRANSSADDVFYAVFPQWVAAAVVMTWIAFNKS
jgi:hypothetical protein